MLYACPAVLVVLGVVVWWLRGSRGRFEARFRQAVTAWVQGQGGTVTFDARGHATIEGSLGKGVESLSALRLMCDGRPPEQWATSIGFALRKYVPDQFDALFAKQDRERLAERAPALLALSPDEVRGRLRVRITSARTGAEGLATLATPLVDGLEVRVVLEGEDLAGLPLEVRAKLPEDDDAVRARAQEQSLGAVTPVPTASADDGRQLWLVAAAQRFGNQPFLLGAAGEALLVRPVGAEPVAPVLLELATRATADGPLKGRLFFWDGARLHGGHVVAHTIIGPTTPHYSVTLPPEVRSRLGLVTGPGGAVELRRG